MPSGLWVLPGAGTTLPRQALDTGQLGRVLNQLDDMAEFVLMDGARGSMRAFSMWRVCRTRS